jgi:hypothetical protein
MVYAIGKRNNQTVVLVTKQNGNDPFSLHDRKTENGDQISLCGKLRRQKGTRYHYKIYG